VPDPCPSKILILLPGVIGLFFPERDARISELSSKLENLHDTLRESSRKVQTSEGESEVQSRRMAALEKRVHGVEATKAGLERQLDVANRLHDELEVSTDDIVSHFTLVMHALSSDCRTNWHLSLAYYLCWDDIFDS
jgi:chromosome segregation ATPase